MKIKVKKLSLDQVMNIPVPKHKMPKKPPIMFRFLMKALGASDLKDTEFKYDFVNIDKIPDEPCLVLMNHSAFIDLEIASNLFWPKPLAIVCTSDGFVGKESLMRNLGCIPKNKFVSDPHMISDISYALHNNKTSVLMYPEASYTFDGTSTPLPRRSGAVLKMLKAPVLMISTTGAFLRDPLYNCLQKRKVKVSAKIELLLTVEDLKQKSTKEIDSILDEAFSFDGFKWQQENNISVTEPFRADGLHRILYKCPCCNDEGNMEGKGTFIKCNNCGVKAELNEKGFLVSDEEKIFSHIPDWYAWERNAVKKEIEEENYLLDTSVNIKVFRDFKSIYEVGNGRLVHNKEGFSLFDENGNNIYSQKSIQSYSLYADYYWYELGDIICIGSNDILYYCFPSEGIPVAKARLATEEIYKLLKA